MKIALLECGLALVCGLLCLASGSPWFLLPMALALLSALVIVAIEIATE